MPELISVIVSTYNREDALDAVLTGLSQQGDTNFEVVIADDGSGPSTAALVERWGGRIGVPLSHVWHVHDGFRAAEIRNRAILACRGDYCVFLDGDCVARKGFVAAHRGLAEPGWFVTGNRVLLSPALTRAVLCASVRPETLGVVPWIKHRLSGDINRLAALLPLPLGLLRKCAPLQWRGARSCNLAVWRADLVRVDGFDAGFYGWGREDSDLLVRLIHAGLRRKDGRFATGVMHLWHPPADRGQLTQNDARLAAVLGSDRVRAERGLSALEQEAGASMRADQCARAQS
ncbi:MAG: glycosyltransferase family 2 protein [Xanthobacteraceae bacterium]